MFLGNNLLVRSNQLIKFVAILKPDVCIISTAIFVPLGGAQIWGLYSEPYKFLWHILKKNSAAENCMDVRLGQVVNLSIFYNIWNSQWLQTFPEGFDFSFRWRDSENHAPIHLPAEPKRKQKGSLSWF